MQEINLENENFQKRNITIRVDIAQQLMFLVRAPMLRSTWFWPVVNPGCRQYVPVFCAKHEPVAAQYFDVYLRYFEYYRVEFRGSWIFPMRRYELLGWLQRQQR